MQIDPTSITWDNDPAPSRAPGVIRGPAPTLDPNQARSNDRADASEARTTAGQTFRTMTAEEVQQQGLPQGGVYQINGLGEIKTVSKAAEPEPAPNLGSQKERLARIQTALENLDGLEGLVRSSNMGTGSIVGQESFRSGDDFGGLSAFMNETANNVSGSIEMVQGDLINQVRAEMQESGAPIGVKGADTEKEASRLAASIANLAQTQDEEQFLIGLQRAREYYQRRQAAITESIDPSHSESVQDEFDNEFGIPLTGGRTTDDRPRDGDDLPLRGTVTDTTGVDTGKEFGSDGQGNPLIYIANEGPNKGVVQVLLKKEQGQEGVFYGPASENPEGRIDPRALEFYRRFQRDNELRGEPGFFDVAKSGMSLGLLDEASGVGQVIGQALLGDFNIAENFEEGKDLEALRIEQGRDALGGAALPVELLGAGGAVRVASGFNQARGAVQSLRNSGQTVNRANVQRNLTNRATAEGAAIGGVAGAAQGEGLEERGVNAMFGTLTGGLLGRGGQSLGNTISNRAVSSRAAAPTQSQEIAEAAAQEGIDLIPAVTGGTATRSLTTGARQGFISDIPIEGAVNRMNAQGQAARTRASQAAGDAVNAEDAGEIVRRGAEIYSKRTSEVGGKLYDRADNLAQNQRFPLTDALRTARNELSELRQAPGGAESVLAQELTALIRQMGGRQVTVEGTRALRTRLRNEIMQRGLRGSPEDRIYQKILQAADRDMISGLQAAGKDDAVSALRTANEFWRNRVETIDQVLEPLIGRNAPRSGEQILSSLERMARPDSGNSANLRRLMEAMPENEANAVRATVIDRMGRPTRGSANLDQEGFDFGTFLTHWNNMSPRARATMFPKQSIDALNRLAKIGVGAKEARNSLNSSNTARALVSQGAISGGLAWLINPLAAVGVGAGQYGIGRLLASPKFARLLAGAPQNANPAQVQAFKKRLGNLAQSEPAIAPEIQHYLRALSANDNSVGQLAAENGNQQPAN